MRMSFTAPERDQIGSEAPLRLRVAAALAFPDGSMTASGMRGLKTDVGRLHRRARSNRAEAALGS
jgi:hypothetical protein